MLWTFDESIGDPQTVEIQWNPPPPAKKKITYSLEYVPYVYTKTEYDDRNRVALRTTTERTYIPVVNGSWFKEALEFYGALYSGTYPLYIITEERYEYDDSGNIKKQTQKRYEPIMASVGKSAIKYVYQTQEDGKTVQEIYNPAIDSSELAEMNITEYDRWEAVSGNVVIRYTKTKRTSHKLLLHTQEGQQALARQAEDAATYAEVIDLAFSMVQTLVIDSVELQNQSEASTVEADTVAPPDQSRPDPEVLLLQGRDLRAYPSDKEKQTKQLKKEPIKVKQKNGPAQDPPPDREYAVESPYLFEDWYVPSDEPGIYVASGYTIKAQLLSYARIQNRLRAAHRSGLSLQLAPELIPVRPFDPIYVNLSGIVGQYRVNATSWAFSASGIAAQIDAAFWGGVGTT